MPYVRKALVKGVNTRIRVSVIVKAKGGEKVYKATITEITLNKGKIEKWGMSCEDINELLSKLQYAVDGENTLEIHITKE